MPENGADKLEPTPLERLLVLLELETRGGIKPHDYADRALWYLLTFYEGCLPQLDGKFHQSFREGAVTTSGHADMAIWNLLNSSTRFWRLFEQVQPEKEV